MEERESNKRGMNLLDLPEGCLSHILSLTSPFYVLRSSLVCKFFNSIAKSDLVWEKFLPSDYHPFIQRSSSSLSTKLIVLHLCRSFILLEDEQKSFSLDKWTGKKCYMFGARELAIASGENPRCWRWKPLPESRFPEVAELLGVAELYITARISTQLLSPDTTYHMYFSFMLGAWSRGFDVCPVKVFVSKIDTNGAYIGGSGYDTSKTFYLKAPESDDMFDDVEGEEAFEHRRDSGHRWIKIDMGKYFNRVGDDVAVLEMTLMGTEVGLHKSGLIVHGIEILPLD
ncbi:putative F-box protein PP2-B12 [Chenopodium quinoa]|uniref:putative F-box protein PP2-B12 n=1 Tax=Chenopodium quinoa TaxID=63459 RepID=UPI000B78ABA2|nr:putative F-box protein PP2-B12 [Chenopodium quinoa]